MVPSTTVRVSAGTTTSWRPRPDIRIWCTYGIHPDQHFLVVHPNNPLQFWESSDGGTMRSSGQVTDISANCASRSLSGAVLTRCQQLLSRVPTKLTSIPRLHSSTSPSFLTRRSTRRCLWELATYGGARQTALEHRRLLS